MSYIPNNISDCICVANIELEKGLFALNELTNDYAFLTRPVANLDTANKEATKWLWEYGRITTLISIAEDYVFNISKLLEKAQQLEDERRKGGVTNGK